MEGVTGMMARLSHMQRVAAGGSAMYRTRVFFSDRVRATVATSQSFGEGNVGCERLCCAYCGCVAPTVLCQILVAC